MPPLVNKALQILSTVLMLSIFFACTNNSPQHNEWDALKLKEADLVFRTGRSMASRVVLASDSEGYYSHIGIIVMQNNTLLVAHAVPGESRPNEPDTVKTESLSDFFNYNKAKSGCIMRLDITSEQKQQIAKYALQKAQCGTLFDHRYDLGDTTKLYCTELVWMAYQSAGIDITNNTRKYINFSKFKGDMIFPSHIQKNKNLKQVYSFTKH
ncbi:MAG: hypothetical protein JXR50_09970 [Prolixibacteraceae bacterium]|nr:hypothetical protein [Prolixibacteraceae bacterium]MBN2650052.1 hypothetical protein [Prolixibacteraceae bacterium]